MSDSTLRDQDVSAVNKAFYETTTEITRQYIVPVRHALSQRSTRYTAPRYWLHFTTLAEIQMASQGKPVYHLLFCAAVDKFHTSLVPESGFSRTSLDKVLDTLGMTISQCKPPHYFETYPLHCGYTAMLDALEWPTHD